MMSNPIIFKKNCRLKLKVQMKCFFLKKVNFKEVFFKKTALFIEILTKQDVS